MAYGAIKGIMDNLVPADRAIVIATFVKEFGEEGKRAEAPTLSPAEFKALQLAAEGCTGALIGRLTGVSERTAEGRLESVRAKMNTKNRVNTVAEAFRRGMLT